jgi:hypothetical protein
MDKAYMEGFREGLEIEAHIKGMLEQLEGDKDVLQ